MNEEGLPIFSFSMSSLIASLIFGTLGLWLFREGKKRLNHPVLAIGLILMIYPLFTTGPWTDWGIGFILTGAAYFFW